MTRSMIALCLLAAAAAPSVAQAQYPTEPPPATPVRPLQFPDFAEIRLSNGLEIVVVENHELPVVSIFLTMPAGAVRDPDGLAGLASITAALLTKGTSTRSAEEIAEAIESVGGSLVAGAGNDFFTLSTTVLTDHLDAAFALFGEVLLDASFPDEELELVRTRTLSALQVQKSQPQAIASEFFAREVYGDHPYGSSESEASVNAITREAVLRFHTDNLRPQGAILVAAGDISPERIRALAEEHLVDWVGGPPPIAESSLPPASATDILLVHRPGSDQSTIVVGNTALRPGDDDYYASLVTNRVLGGGADSRLFLILREQRGWTYGAYSNVSRPKQVGRFQAGANTRPEVTDSALNELLAQLRRMRNEPVPADEIVQAKGFLIGSFPRRIQTAQQVAQQVGAVKLLGLGDEYLSTYLPRLDAVTVGDVQRAANRIITPDSAVVLVVGDGSKIYDQLAAIAPVRIVDVNGNALSPGDLIVREVAIEFDVDLLTARRDSFQVSFQGNAIGHQIREIAYEGDDLIVRVQVAIALAGLEQAEEGRLAASDLTMRSYHQSGTIQGLSVSTDLSYEGGRATGTAMDLSQDGTIDTVTVDAEILPGVLDDQIISHIVPSLPLADGAEITVNVFNAVSGTTVPLTISVSAAPDVTVPAGTFAVWKTHVTGGKTPTTLYVSREGVRRIVKLELVGQPISFELAGHSP